MLITLESVLLEAEKANPDAESEDDMETGTDYTDAGDEETDSGSATEDTDEDAGEGEDEPADDEGGDDAGGDEGTDYTDDGGDEGTTDDGTDTSQDDTDNDTGDDGGMDVGDSGDSGIESEDQIKERHRKVKSLMLLKEMTRLYHTVKSFITEVTTREKRNILFSAVQKNVVANFDNLANLIYNYVLFYYDHMSYEYNLYTYNYFVETCKVNIELMNKVASKDDVEYA